MCVRALYLVYFSGLLSVFSLVTIFSTKKIPTLDSGINIGVRLLIFEKKIEGKKMKNDRNALFDVKMN